MCATSAASAGRRRLFVTTALPYANGLFHIGHIMEYIQADIWVRFQRMRGHDVHFVGADDTHGAAIMLAADAQGITPQALVAKIAATRPKHLNGFHLSFDHWHSTDSPENVNEDPYGDGWLVKIRLSEPSEVDELMDASTYEGTLS